MLQVYRGEPRRCYLHRVVPRCTSAEIALDGPHQLHARSSFILVLERLYRTRDVEAVEQGLGLGCADILPRPPDPARLGASLRIVARIPCILDEVLDLEDGGKGLAEESRPRSAGCDDEGREHLDVSVSAEATYARGMCEQKKGGSLCVSVSGKK